MRIESTDLQLSLTEEYGQRIPGASMPDSALELGVTPEDAQAASERDLATRIPLSQLADLSIDGTPEAVDNQPDETQEHPRDEAVPAPPLQTGGSGGMSEPPAELPAAGGFEEPEEEPDEPPGEAGQPAEAVSEASPREDRGADPEIEEAIASTQAAIEEARGRTGQTSDRRGDSLAEESYRGLDDVFGATPPEPISETLSEAPDSRSQEGPAIESHETEGGEQEPAEQYAGRLGVIVGEGVPVPAHIEERMERWEAYCPHPEFNRALQADVPSSTEPFVPNDTESLPEHPYEDSVVSPMDAYRTSWAVSRLNAEAGEIRVIYGMYASPQDAAPAARIGLEQTRVPEGEERIYTRLVYADPTDLARIVNLERDLYDVEASPQGPEVPHAGKLGVVVGRGVTITPEVERAARLWEQRPHPEYDPSIGLSGSRAALETRAEIFATSRVHTEDSVETPVTAFRLSRAISEVNAASGRLRVIYEMHGNARDAEPDIWPPAEEAAWALEDPNTIYTRLHYIDPDVQPLLMEVENELAELDTPAGQSPDTHNYRHVFPERPEL